MGERGRSACFHPLWDASVFVSIRSIDKNAVQKTEMITHYSVPRRMSKIAVANALFTSMWQFWTRGKEDEESNIISGTDVVDEIKTLA